jgi:hypothetical protein
LSEVTLLPTEEETARLVSMAASNCPERDLLLAAATESVERIRILTDEQIQALKEKDCSRLFALARDLEKAFGERQRAFDSLHQHIADHGCRC